MLLRAGQVTRINWVKRNQEIRSKHGADIIIIIITVVVVVIYIIITIIINIVVVLVSVDLENS